MVLILPEAHTEFYSPAGATTSGLLASIRAALAMECSPEADSVSVRVLGTFVVLEGLVPDDDCIARIHAVAEDIAGTGKVRLCLFRQ